MSSRTLRLTITTTGLVIAAGIFQSWYLFVLAIALLLGAIMLRLWSRAVGSESGVLWSGALFFMAVGGAFLGAAVYFIALGSPSSAFMKIALPVALSLFGLYMLYLGGGIAYFCVSGERPPGSARLASLSRSMLERDALGRRRAN
jgi:hypothetical protein